MLGMTASDIISGSDVPETVENLVTTQSPVAGYQKTPINDDSIVQVQPNPTPVVIQTSTAPIWGYNPEAQETKPKDTQSYVNTNAAAWSEGWF